MLLIGNGTEGCAVRNFSSLDGEVLLRNGMHLQNIRERVAFYLSGSSQPSDDFHLHQEPTETVYFSNHI